MTDKKRICTFAFAFALSLEAVVCRAPAAVTGRFVHVVLPGEKRTLSLAEVEVFSGGENIARRGAATQSGVDFNGPAALAIDGGKNDIYKKGTMTHTRERVPAPWWELDLKKSADIENIAVWNRREPFAGRLDGFRVYVLDEKRTVVWEDAAARPGRTTVFAVAEKTGGMIGKKVPKKKPRAGGKKKRKRKGGAVDSGPRPAPSGKDHTSRYWTKRNGWPSWPAVNTPASVARAINDLIETFGDRYPDGTKYRARLEQVEDDEEAFRKLRREALLANPLLDFDRILAVRRRFGKKARKVTGKGIGAPKLNSHTNDDLNPSKGWTNDLVVISDLRQEVKCVSLFAPPAGRIARDLEVGWDAEKIMFSSGDGTDRWQLFEIPADGSGAMRQLSPSIPRVDFFDSCYLPDGTIITCSTASYQGLPCEGGKREMVNLYRLDPATGDIRQLTFEQDSDWHPCVLHNGRLLYLRWEYTDTPHYFTRILFNCKPDGTDQREYWGSNSYFPTAFKHARPMPGHPTRVVGILGGHHAVPETGRLAIIDPKLGRRYPFRFHPKDKEWKNNPIFVRPDKVDIVPEVLPAEKTGFVQEIPGWGRDVVGNVKDSQGEDTKYVFVYPCPLSEKYVLVSMKTGDSLWGLYLVDVFDNMTLIYEEEGCGLFEPFPFRPRRRPAPIADIVNTGQDTARVYIQDVYFGRGLPGVPRGTVKKLRLFYWYYAPRGKGGHDRLGTESGWDVKAILGTVPVEEDGSASFIIPANTPISLQPLDDENRALQLMRSWLVGMPGENVSCYGCHETQNDVGASKATRAMKRAPSQIEPWYGPTRPFGFENEVYPVVRKYCLGCHDGKKEIRGTTPLSLAGSKRAYDRLRPYVRAPGPESDYEIMVPMEYHCSTCELFQILEKNHYNVELDEESRDRFYTWVDLNAPYKGTWTTPDDAVTVRRYELAKQYAGIDYNPEKQYRRAADRYKKRGDITPVIPSPPPPAGDDGLAVAGFPFDADRAKRMQKDLGKHRITVKMTEHVSMDFVKIPPGRFIMGSRRGFPDERPRAVAEVPAPFWMGVTEVTNGQYAVFDPDHDTRYIDEHGKDHTIPGYIANHPHQPVARVSWKEAMRFCGWFAEKTGKTVSLPTEAEWEWAARAGTATRFFYGDADTDFGPYANLADASRRFTRNKWDGGSKLHVRRPYTGRFPLRDDRFTDRYFIVDYAGETAANPWGLKDMIGNVCEWTLSGCAPYPYDAGDGRNDGNPERRKVARGGSWQDRPTIAGSSVRLAYEPWQKVFDVGFRIVVNE